MTECLCSQHGGADQVSALRNSVTHGFTTTMPMRLFVVHITIMVRHSVKSDVLYDCPLVGALETANMELTRTGVPGHTC